MREDFPPDSDGGALWLVLDVLAAILIYQLLVRMNHQRGHKNGRLRWITDPL